MSRNRPVEGVGSPLPKTQANANVRSQKGAKTMPMGAPIKSVDEVLGMSSAPYPMNPCAQQPKVGAKGPSQG